jgi:hypothetical protein
MSGHTFGRITRVYNQEERNVINQFKSPYMEATSPAARKDIAQMEIFPSLFNYWASIGEVIGTDEHKLRSEVCSKYHLECILNLILTFIKKLLSWLRNVWRTQKKGPLTAKNKYKLTDVLWWTREADVLDEIASIMNMETVTTNTIGWFQHRTKASKNIIDRMTNTEKLKLQAEADRMAAEGLPERIQRK